ncbi:MAG: hypothetical protein WD691_10870 [Acidimicrobiales bacterium]
MAEHAAVGDTGSGLTRASVWATAALALSGGAAAAWPDTFAAPHAVFSGLMFVTGVGAFLLAYFVGISRSRTDAVTLSGLFFLSGGTASAEVRRRLRLATLAQTAIVVTAAMVRPYTEVAYGILAPMFGLGVMALWGGRHGVFPPRVPRS